MHKTLEIIRKASKSITTDLKSSYPNIPWKQMLVSRNIVTHEYFRLHVNEICATIQNDLPVLKAQVLLVLNDLEEGHA